MQQRPNAVEDIDKRWVQEQTVLLEGDDPAVEVDRLGGVGEGDGVLRLGDATV